LSSDKETFYVVVGFHEGQNLIVRAQRDARDYITDVSVEFGDALGSDAGFSEDYLFRYPARTRFKSSSEARYAADKAHVDYTWVRKVTLLKRNTSRRFGK